MNTTTTHPHADGTASVPVQRRERTRRRVGAALSMLALTLAGLMLPAASADAGQRLGNGAYGSYGLDCSGYRSARLSVQGGANGVPVTGFKYWLYNVNSGQYVVSGAWVALGTGWNTTTITVTRTPGRYMVLVQYWSNAGGAWYASSGEWAWATNLLQPVTSQICTVL